MRNRKGLAGQRLEIHHIDGIFGAGRAGFLRGGIRQQGTAGQKAEKLTTSGHWLIIILGSISTTWSGSVCG